MSRPITSTTDTRRPVTGRRAPGNDYEHALQIAGGLIRYDIEALVARDDTVAVVWTGHLANGSDYRGLSLYRVADGRVAEIRQSLIGEAPD